MVAMTLFSSFKIFTVLICFQFFSSSMIYFSFYAVLVSLFETEGVVAGGRMSNKGEPVDLRLHGHTRRRHLPWTSCPRDTFTLKHRNLIKFSVDICFYYLFSTIVISVVNNYVYATAAYKPVRLPPYLYNRSSKLVRTLFPLLYLDLVREGGWQSPTHAAVTQSSLLTLIEKPPLFQDALLLCDIGLFTSY